MYLRGESQLSKLLNFSYIRDNTILKLHPSDLGRVTEDLLEDPDARPDDVVEHVVQDLEVGQRNERSKSTGLDY